MIDNDSVRPWGRYEILQESKLHKVKCIYVNPGSRLSYQRHHMGAEVFSRCMMKVNTT